MASNRAPYSWEFAFSSVQHGSFVAHEWHEPEAEDA